MKRITILIIILLAVMGARCEESSMTPNSTARPHRPVNAVPEPGAGLLFGIGIIVLMGAMKRRSE